jgi:hypothetical protein
VSSMEYMAGFFDGEGCISYGTRKNTNSNKTYFRSAIQVGQNVAAIPATVWGLHI